MRYRMPAVCRHSCSWPAPGARSIVDRLAWHRQHRAGRATPTSSATGQHLDPVQPGRAGPARWPIRSRGLRSWCSLAALGTRTDLSGHLPRCDPSIGAGCPCQHLDVLRLAGAGRLRHRQAAGLAPPAPRRPSDSHQFGHRPAPRHRSAWQSWPGMLADPIPWPSSLVATCGTRPDLPSHQHHTGQHLDVLRLAGAGRLRHRRAAGPAPPAPRRLGGSHQSGHRPAPRHRSAWQSWPEIGPHGL